MKKIDLRTSKRNEFLDITAEVSDLVEKSGTKNGLCVLYVPHTTAAITINESADPAVKRDILQKLSEMAPESKEYSHTEGNADSHIKSSLMGCSVLVPVENGSLALGTWQGIFFCEFDGPRSRSVLFSSIEC